MIGRGNTYSYHGSNAGIPATQADMLITQHEMDITHEIDIEHVRRFLGGSNQQQHDGEARATRSQRNKISSRVCAGIGPGNGATNSGGRTRLGFVQVCSVQQRPPKKKALERSRPQVLRASSLELQSHQAAARPNLKTVPRSAPTQPVCARNCALLGQLLGVVSLARPAGGV